MHLNLDNAVQFIAKPVLFFQILHLISLRRRIEAFLVQICTGDRGTARTGSPRRTVRPELTYGFPFYRAAANVAHNSSGRVRFLFVGGGAHTHKHTYFPHISPVCVCEYRNHSTVNHVCLSGPRMPSSYSALDRRARTRLALFSEG